MCPSVMTLRVCADGLSVCSDCCVVRCAYPVPPGPVPAPHHHERRQRSTVPLPGPVLHAAVDSHGRAHGADERHVQQRVRDHAVHSTPSAAAATRPNSAYYPSVHARVVSCRVVFAVFVVVIVVVVSCHARHTRPVPAISVV